MSSSKKRTIRQQLHDKKGRPDPLDRKPLEIPVDARATGRSIEDEIQRQIAMNEAKKRSGAST